MQTNAKTNRRRLCGLLAAVSSVMAAGPGGPLTSRADVVFDEYSPYHHVRVEDQRGLRTLLFNTAQESRMSLADPLKGHFEYTEYFHMPLIWKPDARRVLLLGLGGGSIQRSFLHYYTNMMIETVELDPLVVKVASNYFGVKESPRHKIHLDDGRVFVHRSRATYDLMILDAYTTTRYGSSIPPQLTTKEFFTLASERLGTNGVLAYNVIGQMQGLGQNLMGSIYRTMKKVFPHVYLFPSSSTWNVVLVATKSKESYDSFRVQQIGTQLVLARRVTFPMFSTRLHAFQATPPKNFATSPILTDDQAPVERLSGGTPAKK